MSRNQSKPAIPKEPKPGTPEARVRKAKQNAKREAVNAGEALEDTKETAQNPVNKGYHDPKAKPAKRSVKAAQKAGKYAKEAKDAAKKTTEPEAQSEANEAVDAAAQAKNSADQAKQIAELSPQEEHEARAEGDSEIANENQ